MGEISSNNPPENLPPPELKTDQPQLLTPEEIAQQHKVKEAADFAEVKEAQTPERIKELKSKVVEFLSEDETTRKNVAKELGLGENATALEIDDLQDKYEKLSDEQRQKIDDEKISIAEYFGFGEKVKQNDIPLKEAPGEKLQEKTDQEVAQEMIAAAQGMTFDELNPLVIEVYKKIKDKNLRSQTITTLNQLLEVKMQEKLGKLKEQHQQTVTDWEEGKITMGEAEDVLKGKKRPSPEQVKFAQETNAQREKEARQREAERKFSEESNQFLLGLAKLLAGKNKAAKAIDDQEVLELIFQANQKIRSVIESQGEALGPVEIQKLRDIEQDFINKSGAIESRRKVKQQIEGVAKKDLYKYLDLTSDASEKKIKIQYRKLSQQYHPDVNGGEDKKFKEINDAYDILSDKNLRERYDTRRSQFILYGN